MKKNRIENTLKNKGKTLKLTILGFTLIELLAVIVILAIIATIAAPIVLDIINDARESATLRSAEYYLDAVETSLATAILKNTNINDGTYKLKDGDICLDSNCIQKLEVQIKGEKPSTGTITIGSGNVNALSIVLNQRTILKNIDGNLIYADKEIDPIPLSSAIFRDNTAYADNVKSPYVDSNTGINFSKISSDTNGKGLYYTNKNTENNKITYYFRGDVKNNYVNFGTQETCKYNGIDTLYIENLEEIEAKEPNSEQCTSTNVCKIPVVGNLLGISGIVGLDETECNTLIGSFLNNYVGNESSQLTCVYNGEPVVGLVGENLMFDLTKEQCETGNVCLMSSLGINLPFTGIDSETCIEEGGTFIEEKATYQTYNSYTKEKAIYNPTTPLLWRIVRINEDGSIRLIKEDTLLFESKFNDEDQDNTYVGYMYGTAGSDTYEETHANINDSTMKTYLDDWYSNKSKLSSYASYIEDTGFCNDRSVASTPGLWDSNDTALGYDQNYTIYGPTARLKNAKPQFKCSDEERDLFTTNNSLKGNKALTYPVGLLTIDEVSYAGGVPWEDDPDMYLRNGKYFWTMSPAIYITDEVYSGWEGVDGWYLRSSTEGDIINDLNYTSINATYGVRPVINLKSGVEIIKGNGTEENPYVIKIN